jgi:hypothetical protein
MPRNRIDANIRCPSCNGQLFPRLLVCDSCGLKIEGEFVMNEFDSLTPEELHFLRVFIQCEGRIRDMEAALGVSYPTVKGHMASIKEKLHLSGQRAAAGPGGAPDAASASQEMPTAEAVLEKLESGQLSYKEAVRLLRAIKKEGKGNDSVGG